MRINKYIIFFGLALIWTYFNLDFTYQQLGWQFMTVFGLSLFVEAMLLMIISNFLANVFSKSRRNEKYIDSISETTICQIQSIERAKNFKEELKQNIK